MTIVSGKNLLTRVFLEAERYPFLFLPPPSILDHTFAIDYGVIRAEYYNWISLLFRKIWLEHLLARLTPMARGLQGEILAKPPRLNRKSNRERQRKNLLQHRILGRGKKVERKKELNFGVLVVIHSENWSPFGYCPSQRIDPFHSTYPIHATPRVIDICLSPKQRSGSILTTFILNSHSRKSVFVRRLSLGPILQRNHIHLYVISRSFLSQASPGVASALLVKKGGITLVSES